MRGNSAAHRSAPAAALTARDVAPTPKSRPQRRRAAVSGRAARRRQRERPQNVTVTSTGCACGSSYACACACACAPCAPCDACESQSHCCCLPYPQPTQAGALNRRGALPGPLPCAAWERAWLLYGSRPALGLASPQAGRACHTRTPPRRLLGPARVRWCMGKPRPGAPSGRVASGAAMETGDGAAAGPDSAAAAHDTHTSADYYFDSYAHFGARLARRSGLLAAARHAARSRSAAAA